MFALLFQSSKLSSQLYYYFNLYLNSIYDSQENAHNDGFTYTNPLLTINNPHDVQQLPNNLQPSGLVIGDGNCCPRAISLAHTGSQLNHAIRYILANTQHFENGILQAYSCSVQQYCAQMAQNAEFGEAIVIIGAALILKINIQVFTNRYNDTKSISLTMFAHVQDQRPTITSLICRLSIAFVLTNCDWQN
ncbi:hypothetical protein BC830DRAFT_755979 [Chytriomyces sp. MP71]|nr:hypothetical protein BC830DRAFT_755979 [Chytriomyces sp. MP71]